MISYKPFLKLLIDRDLKKIDVLNTGIISKGTLNKMNSNKYVSLEVIDKLCNHFNVGVTDIIEFIPDQTRKDI